MIPDLYILRHGETLWNRAGRMQGHLDSPLTDRGVAQARRQGALLAGRGLTGVAAYSSPLGRAVQTAQLALQGITDDIRHDDRLKEIDMGHWQGQLRSDVAPAAQAIGPDGDLTLYDRAPGEGLAAVAARARSFVAERDAPAIIICHGIVSRFLRCAALGLPDTAWADLPGGQGNVFYLTRGTMQELR